MISIYDISNHHTLLNLCNPIHPPTTTNNNNNNNKNSIFNNQYNSNKSAITHHNINNNNNSNINMHIMSIRLKLLALYMIA